jgi:predicted metal-dependent peptidase
MDTTTTTQLSESFVYLVSPRGGNSYWAVVINGCDKLYTTEINTLAVQLTPNGRYILMCNNEYFAKRSDPMKKLILVHEAGHIALRHIERLCKLLSFIVDPSLRESVMAVYNIAADFAVNDSIVRNEKEFKAMMDEEQFDGLLPEAWGLPTGQSMEKYMLLLVERREEIKQLLKDMLDSECGDEDDEEGDGEGEGEGDDQEGSGSSLSKGNKPAKTGKSGKGGKKPGKGGAGNGSEEDEERIGEAARQSVVEAVANAMQVDPDYFKKLQKAFDQSASKTHEQWNKVAGELTPEEAVSMASKLKQHAKRLVKSAHEQIAARGRGFAPNGIEELVGSLLAQEQVPWTWLFNDLIATSIAPKVIEEMACPNLMLINDMNVEPWPGFALDHEFHIAWLNDTSGSVNNREYARACLELNGLLKMNKNIRLRYMECDAAMQKEMFVDNLEPPDEEEMKKVRTRKGFGGTVYTPAFKRILGLDTPADWARSAARPTELPRRPDLLIVYTDGGVVIEGEVFPQFHPQCPIIWLVAPGCHTVPGMNDVPPDHVVKMFDMKESED